METKNDPIPRDRQHSPHDEACVRAVEAWLAEGGWLPPTCLDLALGAFLGTLHSYLEGDRERFRRAVQRLLGTRADCPEEEPVVLGPRGVPSPPVIPLPGPALPAYELAVRRGLFLLDRLFRGDLPSLLRELPGSPRPDLADALEALPPLIDQALARRARDRMSGMYAELAVALGHDAQEDWYAIGTPAHAAEEMADAAEFIPWWHEHREYERPQRVVDEYESNPRRFARPPDDDFHARETEIAIFGAVFSIARVYLELAWDAAAAAERSSGDATAVASWCARRERVIDRALAALRDAAALETG
ncbi:MAG: hypothetical protein ACTHU0_35840 [Kofleriaceae bacterium]